MALSPDKQAWIRTEVRPKLAGAIHHCLTQMEPLIRKNDRSKAWSHSERFDAREVVEALLVTVGEVGEALDRLPGKTRMGRVDKDRYLRAFKGLNGAVQLYRRVPISKMQELDEKTPRGGQRYFLAMFRQMMIVLRHALAALFYMVNDAKLVTIRMTKKDTDSVRYSLPNVREAIFESYQERARKKAHSSGHFVEVVTSDGEIVFDASPHPSTIRREMAVVERKTREAFPYVANPKIRDYDVLIELYQDPFLQ